MQTQTNKLTEFVWSLLFLFARYKVQGCLVNKLNLNSSHVHFWNMSLKILYRARLKQGGWSGIRLTLSKCEMYPPKTAFFPPEIFWHCVEQTHRESSYAKLYRGLPPSRFSKRDPDSSHLALEKQGAQWSFQLSKYLEVSWFSLVFFMTVMSNFFLKRKCVACVYIRSRLSWTQGARVKVEVSQLKVTL